MCLQRRGWARRHGAGLSRELTPLLGRAHVQEDEDGLKLVLPPQSGAAFLAEWTRDSGLEEDATVG